MEIIDTGLLERFALLNEDCALIMDESISEQEYAEMTEYLGIGEDNG